MAGFFLAFVRDPVAVGDFPSTLWTLIQQAKAGETSALNEFVGRYRPAIVTFLTRQGLTPDQAEDVAQEAFLVLVRNDVLARVEREGGRFRSFLIAVTKNVLGNVWKREHAAKRGGGAGTVSLDQAPEERVAGLERTLAAAANDEAFDHLWVMNLLDRAVERLAAESGIRGTPYAEALRLVTDSGCSYREAAERLGTGEEDVRRYVHRARGLLADYLRQEVAAYSVHTADYQQELAYLSCFLQRERHASGHAR